MVGMCSAFTGMAHCASSWARTIESSLMVKAPITVDDLAGVIYSAGRGLENLSTGRLATESLPTGSTAAITSRADLTLLEDLRDAARVVITAVTNHTLVDAELVTIVNAATICSGALHPGRLRTYAGAPERTQLRTVADAPAGTDHRGTAAGPAADCQSGRLHRHHRRTVRVELRTQHRRWRGQDDRPDRPGRLALHGIRP